MTDDKLDRSRRRVLTHAAGLGAAVSMTAAQARPMPESWTTPGATFSNYGMPEDNGPIRWISADPSVPGEGVSWTPLHDLEGTLVPNGLHFERHHAGIPALDATSWRLELDGLLERPLAFDFDAIQRFPRRSRIAFIECGGNSNALWRPNPAQAPVGWLHGLLSSAEWTGVPLSLLLAEAGVRPEARWLIAEGLDASGMRVSIPLDALPENSMLALFQNGEPLRAAQGWPARLVLPGLEGVVQVKWLGRLTLADKPALSRFDTSAYSDLTRDGKIERFTRTMGVKSVITSPTVGREVPEGFVEVSGLAWSGAGRIARVEVSLDGGKRWSDASLDGPVLRHALTRFRLPWRRDELSNDVVIASRATDEAGRVQPTRAGLLGVYTHETYYHYNAICGLRVDRAGFVEHVHV